MSVCRVIQVNQNVDCLIFGTKNQVNVYSLCVKIRNHSKVIVCITFHYCLLPLLFIVILSSSLSFGEGKGGVVFYAQSILVEE